MSLIYLGSPYTHKDTDVMQKRFELVAEVTARLLNKGHIIYCPIAHCHPIAEMYDLPRDSDFWYKHNITVLRHCQALWILALDGYKESTGLKREIVFAEQARIPVHFFNYESITENT